MLFSEGEQALKLQAVQEVLSPVSGRHLKDPASLTVDCTDKGSTVGFTQKVD